MPRFPPHSGYFLLRAEHPKHHDRGILIGTDSSAGVPAVYNSSLTEHLFGPVADVPNESNNREKCPPEDIRRVKGAFRKTLLES